ncbi:MAG TPA: ATP-binding protein [Gemmatimonadales bacterium]|nr:ATP-binding protein [Gemmatimonadales bacterium]
MSPAPDAVWWIFLSAALALCVILVALGAALVLTQRRFITLHREYAERLLEAQEQERAWVAREVHDDALQRVALVVHELQDIAAEREPGGNGRWQRLEAVREEIEDLGVMLRRLAHRLHPSVIDQAGLVPALRALATDMARGSGLELEVAEDASQPWHLPRERALLLFRIAQEAVRNIAKHAAVARATVRVAVRDGTLELAIQDAGRGFTPNELAQRRGLGLISMEERARLAEGRLEITSKPGGGTTVRVTVPVERGAT